MASYETVYKGNSAHELGLTVRYRVVQFYDMLVTIGGFASFGKNGWRGAQAHLKLEAPISRWFHVNGAYYLWDSNTLDGERQIPSQEKSNIDHEFMLGFSLRF